MTARGIEPHEKREHEPEHEVTAAGKHFVPYTDIFETPDGLTLVVDMPGASRDRIEILLDKDRLTIEGRIDQGPYDGLKPLYTEYNVGHFTRTFSVSRRVDPDGITADVENGVLTLHLPIAAESKPRRIVVK